MKNINKVIVIILILIGIVGICLNTNSKADTTNNSVSNLYVSRGMNTTKYSTPLIIDIVAPSFSGAFSFGTANIIPICIDDNSFLFNVNIDPGGRITTTLTQVLVYDYKLKTLVNKKCSEIR